MGLSHLLQYLSYMRPGEGDNLLVLQMVPPVKVTGSKSWALLLSAAETHRPGKTGEIDETVMLDGALATSLNFVWADLTKGRIANERLWPFTPDEFATEFADTLNTAKLSEMGYV
eukprot:12042837-Karenia_brevis.AAC.1